jgi:arylsulfatase A-like enzyme
VHSDGVQAIRLPWLIAAVKLPAFDDDMWELYDTNTDWSQSKDLAKEDPSKAARTSKAVVN